MTDIDVTNIRKLDMTLLLIFQELMRQRKLTVAAQRLGFTQSAVSHNLRRLREIFGDELFLRRPAGVEPTPRALELEPQIRAMLEMADEAIRGRTFSPADASGVVRIAAPDYHSTLLAASLIERIQEAAPRLQLSFRPLVRQAALQALETGDADIALGFFWNTGNRFRSRTLYEDDYVVVARRGHPALKEILTLDIYLHVQHIIVSLDGSVGGIVDRILAREGHKRSLVAAVPFFFSALAVVSRSDLVATLPRRFAEAFAPAFGLGLWEPPFKIRNYRVSAVWHERHANSPLHSWVLEHLAQSTAPRPVPGSRALRHPLSPP